MLRGSWCIVIAVAGLALGAANKGPVAPDSVSGNKSSTQAQTGNKAPSALSQTQSAPEPDKSDPKDRGCPDSKDRRDSDLCAQWKAADAAFDAARAAERQTIIGWIGLVLGGITMGAAIAAAMFAKSAAHWTRLGSTAANKAVDETIISNAISRKAAAEAAVFNRTTSDFARAADAKTDKHSRTQMRPYLGILSGSIAGIIVQPCAKIVLKNFGQTPAFSCKIGGQLVRRPKGHKIGIRSPDISVAETELAPSQEYLLKLVIEDSAPPYAIGENDTLYVVIACEYADGFGQQHVFNACLAADNEGHLTPYPFETWAT